LTDGYVPFRITAVDYTDGTSPDLDDPTRYNVLYWRNPGDVAVEAEVGLSTSGFVGKHEDPRVSDRGILTASERGFPSAAYRA
jgi:hypothetical protein